MIVSLYDFLPHTTLVPCYAKKIHCLLSALLVHTQATSGRGDYDKLSL